MQHTYSKRAKSVCVCVSAFYETFSIWTTCVYRCNHRHVVIVLCVLFLFHFHLCRWFVSFFRWFFYSVTDLLFLFVRCSVLCVRICSIQIWYEGIPTTGQTSTHTYSVGNLLYIVFQRSMCNIRHLDAIQWKTINSMMIAVIKFISQCLVLVWIRCDFILMNDIIQIHL